MKFRMVDRITAWERGRHITGIKAVSFEEYCMASAAGKGECLPQTLALEALVQLGNWLVVLTSDFLRMGLLKEVGRSTFGQMPGAGERILMDMEVRAVDDHGVVLDGAGNAGGREVIRVAGCRLEYAAIEPYASAADLRTLFEEIHRPCEGAVR